MPGWSSVEWGIGNYALVRHERQRKQQQMWKKKGCQINQRWADLTLCTPAVTKVRTTAEQFTPAVHFFQNIPCYIGIHDILMR